RSHPLYVITLARPELHERRPTWGAGQRNFTSMYLEPLSRAAMEALLTGLVPGLPSELRDRILARAEGVPLYAVETVRMLLDRGLLVLEGSVYRLTGPIEALEVPETLHALIAARLDGLSTEERRLLQDAAVLGKTFTKDALGALSGLANTELEPLLDVLTRKEVLVVQADPRSPEHGQYGFVQDLVRHVAYETLSKRDRRSRHLAAADYLATTFAADVDEVVEVIASHYVDAFEAAPDAEDAAEIKQKAQTMLVRAGERAASLGASSEAQRYFQQAAGLTDDPPEQAALLHRAGDMATFAADPDTARRLLSESIELYENVGDTHAAARVSGRLGRVDAFTGHRDEALARMERAFAVVSGDEPDEGLALLAATLANNYWFSGDLERAAERADLALDISEALGFTEGIARALQAKAGIAESRGHPEEAIALTRHALAVSLEHDLAEQAAGYYASLSDFSFRRDRYSDALDYLEQSLELARRVGDRPGEWSALSEMTYPLFMTGRWDEALTVVDDVTEERLHSGAMSLGLLTSVLEIHLQRGELNEARQLVSQFSRLEGSTDLQDQACHLGAKAAISRAEGRLEDALAAGSETLDTARIIGFPHQAVEQGLVEALEATLALGNAARARELLAVIDETPPGRRPPYLEAHAHRFRARLDDEETGFAAAETGFRRLGIIFWLGVTLVEHGEWLAAQGRTDEVEPLLAEAREIFEQLKATPWLERTAQAVPESVAIL
ncbi:MAG: tetratricopeptide repeat protein, partial [Actinomycetota bacterium]|nr:tetratricopeptide repeat protein [Actinomycetota bacterium]